MIRTLVGGKLYIFGFVMVSYACSSMAEAFHQVLDDQKGQKHHENHLSTTFCTNRKYLWENEVLEGQMSSKLGNSTWAGESGILEIKLGEAVQKGQNTGPTTILSLIWMSRSAPKTG